MPDPFLTARCSKRKPRLLRRPRKSETSLMIKEVKKVRLQNQTLQQRNQNIQNQHNRRRIRLYKGHERQTRHTHCRMRLLVEQNQVSNEFHCKQTYLVQNFFNPSILLLLLHHFFAQNNFHLVHDNVVLCVGYILEFSNLR